MKEADIILVEKEGAVAFVTLNRPNVFNALNAELRRRLLQTANTLEEDDNIRVVVLRGAGPGFCAGADLADGISSSVTSQLEEEYRPFLEAIINSRKLWIASVHNSAAGIGGALALVCDFMIMAEGSNIYLAFAAIGLLPDGGLTWLLSRAMGYRRALQIIVEGRKIPADECESLGLANRVVPADQLAEETKRWAFSLAEGAPLSQISAKRVLRKAQDLSYGEAFSLEAAEQQGLKESGDFKEGVEAFFAKRKPVFKGK